MTTIAIQEVHELVQKLSHELGDMSQAAAKHIDDLHVAVNNVASHTLALEAIIAAVARKIDIDEEQVAAWIRDKTAEFSDENDETPVAESIARNLLQK
ncbi:MAG: hypothetical protein ABID63_02520 [Pseudomonadota bacterium]